MKLGDKLKEIRIKRGYTLEEACKGAYIALNTLSLYEKNSQIPSFPILYNIADFYEVDFDKLLKLHPRYTGKTDTIYDRVRDLTIRQGINFIDLAEYIGVQPCYITSLKNVKNPHIEKIEKLAKALGTTTRYLLKGEK